MSHKLKKVEWENENKMSISTGHKTFDRQTVCLTTGNVVSQTQYGHYVRAYSTPTNPFGTPCKPGEMQKFDLQSPLLEHMPKFVLDYIKRLAVDEGVIVYKVFHHYRPKVRNTWTRGYRLGKWTKFVHGWLITGADYKYLYMWVNQAGPKSFNVMAEVSKYLSWRDSDPSEGEQQ